MKNYLIAFVVFMAGCKTITSAVLLVTVFPIVAASDDLTEPPKNSFGSPRQIEQWKSSPYKINVAP